VLALLTKGEAHALVRLERDGLIGARTEPGEGPDRKVSRITRRGIARPQAEGIRHLSVPAPGQRDRPGHVCAAAESHRTRASAPGLYPQNVTNLALHLPSPLVPIRDDRMVSRGLRLYLKRDDLIHSELPGNKWRKLKHNIVAARERNATTMLTFGGAYSNHIRATAAAGHYFGFATIGVIRGEEHLPLNDSLAYAESRGMKLVYMDRATYRAKHSPAVVANLRERFGDFYLVPEGGSNVLATVGCRELVAEIDVDFDLICCPCGTGGTLAGVSMGLAGKQRAMGFSALKGGAFLTDEVSALQRRSLGAVLENWTIECGFHFGGFARGAPELDEFIKSFGNEHGVALERIYVAKMMFGIVALAERGAFAPDTTIIALITG